MTDVLEKIAGALDIANAATDLGVKIADALPPAGSRAATRAARLKRQDLLRAARLRARAKRLRAQALRFPRRAVSLRGRADACDATAAALEDMHTGTCPV